MPTTSLPISYHATSYSARYTFSGKERDEESGFSYFGARYYNSAHSIWMSVDPMSDKYPSLSPYAYCGNNPVKLVDPNGEEIGNYYDWNGNYLGWDGQTDNNVHFVSGHNAKIIKKLKGNAVETNQVKIDISVTKDVISEVLDVAERTEKNGEIREEATFISTNGRYTATGPSRNSLPVDEPAYANVAFDGEILVSIHSHLPYRKIPNSDEIYSNSALRPSTDDKSINANLNVITGPLGDTEWFAFPTGGGTWHPPERGAAFYNKNWELQGAIYIENLSKIVK